MQYYLPGLDDAEEGDSPKFKLEYTTFPASSLHPPAPPEAWTGCEHDATDAPTGAETGADAETETELVSGPCAAAAAARKKFAWPIPKRHLPRTLRNATTAKSKKYAPYGLEDLTVGSWAGLAEDAL